ncbi:MAG: O-antigen ligase family protein [Bacillota bacterium]
MPKATVQAKGARPAQTAAAAGRAAAQRPWADRAAFWGVGALLFFPPFFRGLFFATEQSRALILAAVLFWLAWWGKHSRRDYAFLSHPLDYFVLALPLVYLAAAAGAVNYGLAVDEIVKNVLYFLAYWLVVQLVREEADLSRFLHVIYLAAVGAALAGLATATGIVNIRDGFLNGRIYSSFQYPNALASYLALAGFLGLFFWQKNGPLPLAAAITDRTLQKALPDRLLNLRPFGYLYILANFLLLAVLFGTKSRGGLLITGAVFVLYVAGLPWQKRLPVLAHALLAGGLGYVLIHLFISSAVAKQMGIAWLWIGAGLAAASLAQAAYNFLSSRRPPAWLNDRAKAGRALAGLLGCLAAAGGAFAAFRPELLQKIISFNYLRNAFERTYFIKDALAMLKTRPVLGWGGGGWEEAYRSFQGYLYNSNEVHSYYFQVAVETGVLGLLAVLGIWAAFFWAVHRAYRAAAAGVERKTLVWTLFAGALAVGGHALIDFDLSLSALTIALWTVFAGVRVLAQLPGEREAAGGEGELSGAPAKKGRDKKGFAPVLPAGSGKKGKAAAGKGSSGAQSAPAARREKTSAGKRQTARPPAQPVLVAVYSLISALILFLGITLTAANAYARSASESLQAGKVQEGLAYLQKAAAYNPFNAEYHANLMRVYLAAGKPEPALAEAKQAASLSQYSAARQADLASAHLAAGSTADAVASARRAVELAPYQIIWYETLANVSSLAGQRELAAGNKEAARQHLEEILQIPALIESRVAALGEEEKRLWKDAPMLAPTPRVQLSTGQAHYLLGQLTAAEKDLQSASAAAAGDQQLKGEALVWLALVKEKQGKKQEAQELVKQASALNKAYENAFTQLKALPVL